MKIVALTTDTLHHTYFVRELINLGFDVEVIVEQASLKAPFDTKHPFEVEREDFESRIWFGGERATLKNYKDVHWVDSINEPRTVEILSKNDKSLNVVFGTGKIAQSVIDASWSPLLNLHGADPREYRGLDSVLWAIYHGDFSELKTCLHSVNRELDDGEIVEIMPLSVQQGMKIHQLRSENARVCVEMVRNAASSLAEGRDLELHTQERKGRYYSFMPAVLKEQCVKKFARYAQELT